VLQDAFPVGRTEQVITPETHDPDVLVSKLVGRLLLDCALIDLAHLEIRGAVESERIHTCHTHKSRLLNKYQGMILHIAGTHSNHWHHKLAFPMPKNSDALARYSS
jgi:hypothetical protein